MKAIVQKDTPEGQVLRISSHSIDVDTLPNDEVNQELKDMQEALATQHDGVALAGPQIGISKRVFVVAPIIFKDNPEEMQLVFINPTIIKSSKDKKKMEEGCLSVRGKYGKVRRSTRVTIFAYDENGDEFELSAGGLLAQIFQHEIDHLDGILFVDKAVDIIEITKK